MKNKLVFAMLTALTASGMVFASTPDALPGIGMAANQSGLVSTANPQYKLPGVVGTEETPNEGISPKGETPATGVESAQLGSASPSSDMLPGTDVSTN